MIKPFLRDNIVLICILSAILALCFYDVVFLGKTFKLSTGNPQALMTGPYGQENNKPGYYPVHSTDVPMFEEGIMKFIKDSLRSGILPLWNPHQACGTPLVGMMHTGIFFPLNLILYLLPDIIAWDILIFFRFLLSGLFTYWFMRVLKFKRLPSLTAAIAFMLSGPMTLNQWGFIQVELITPLLLLCLERLIQKPTMRNSACVALSVALTCFSGHPEHVFLVNTYGLIFFCFRVITASPKKTDWKKTLQWFLGSYFLGTCLSAVVLFPFLQNWIFEFWNAHAEAVGALAEGANIRNATLINFIMPHFFQKEPVTMDFVRSTFWGYIGVIPLGLAFLGLWQRQRRGLNYFFAAIAVLIFLKSYVNFPLTNWIGLLPGLRHCRFVHHSQYLFAFSLAMLAGMGARFFSSRKPVLPAGLIYGIPLSIFIALVLAHHRNAPHAKLSLQSSLLGLSMLVLFLGLLWGKDYLGKHGAYKKIPLLQALLLIAFISEIFLYIPHGGRVNRFDSYPSVPYLQFLAEHPGNNPQQRTRSYGIFWTFCPNTASGYRIDDFGIVDGLLPKRYVSFINRFILPGHFQKGKTTSAFWILPMSLANEARPFFDLLNVRYTIAPSPLAQLFPAASRPDFLQPIYDREVKIFEHPNALPRVFIVHKVIFEPEKESTFTIMDKIKNAFHAVAVIEHEPVPAVVEALRNAPLKTDSKAAITHYGINEVTVTATMTHPGFLVLGDSYHPDWKGYVDGKPATVFLTDTLIRSVFLPAGEHTVIFCFRPIWFYVGGLLSLLSGIFLVGILIKRPKSR
ncbi:MAG TPA: hypothetical protein VLJ10_04170 [Candidatus Bathyarchaeia archaeon]|nr:hypothetical protein [Candidatus Bathyarchaeia archaeon]